MTKYGCTCERMTYRGVDYIVSGLVTAAGGDGGSDFVYVKRADGAPIPGAETVYMTTIGLPSGLESAVYRFIEKTAKAERARSAGEQ